MAAVLSLRAKEGRGRQVKGRVSDRVLELTSKEGSVVGGIILTPFVPATARSAVAGLVRE